jgi:hypothetical protein
MTLIAIQCSSVPVAEQLVSDVQAGEVWGIDMGTTSKAVSYSNFVLIECTKTRNLNIYNAEKDLDRYQVCYGTTAPDSFTEARLDWKIWFLRGRL